MKNRYYVIDHDLDNLCIEEVYPELVRKLSVDLKDGGFKVLRELMSTCCEDYRLAGYLHAIVVEDKKRIEDKFDIKMGNWVAEARKVIEEKKKNKEWSGTVYPKDIERYIAANNSEYLKFMEEIRKLERIVRTTKILMEAYSNRLGSLQSYAKQYDKYINVDYEGRKKHERLG